MQSVSSLLFDRHDVRLSEFLEALFQALAAEGLRPCVLRNYEGFPASNVGSDIDFLISPQQLPNALRALRSIEAIRVVGYAQRDYVSTVFLEGISVFRKTRALEIDFDLSLACKGLPYLSTEAVLEAAIPRRAGPLDFFVPSRVHEAVISLLSSLLVGGWLNEKYLPGVQQTFACERSNVIGALQPQLGLKTATQLTDAVISGDRRKILGCRNALRTSLSVRSLRRRPCCSLLAIARHYLREFAVRFAPATRQIVCIVGPDREVRETVVAGLMPLLLSTASVVEKHSPFCGGLADRSSGARVRSFSLIAMVRVTWQLAKDWLGRFTEKKNLTLRICESSGHEFLIDPTRRCGVPRWFARLAGGLLPPADLWILLDGGAQATAMSGQNCPSSRTAEQAEAFRSFVAKKKAHVILNANKSATDVTEDAYAAVMDVLSDHANRRLDRFLASRQMSHRTPL